MMLYPVADKELYLDPYISMLLRLNRELEKKSNWIVIGYSFNDPVIREIFLKKSSSKKRLILVHKRATDIFKEKLSAFKGKISLMDRQFGKVNTFRQINYQIIHELKSEPRFGANEEPLP